MSQLLNALQTARATAEGLNYTGVMFVDDLLADYHEKGKTYIESLHSVPDEHQTVALFGHDPSIHYCTSATTRAVGSCRNPNLTPLCSVPVVCEHSVPVVDVRSGQWPHWTFFDAPNVYQ